METRGGVEAYVATGAPLLAPGGWLVVCGDADAEPRLVAAAVAADLVVAARFVVIPRAGRPPLFTVWALHADTPLPGPESAVERTLTLRDDVGERTDDAKMMRAFSGFAERPPTV